MAASDAPAAVLGLDDRALDSLVAALGEGGIPAQVRHGALKAYRALPARGPSVGRYWKVDVNKIDLEAVPVYREAAGEPAPAKRGLGEAAVFEQSDFGTPTIDVDPQLAKKGLVICDFATAVREYPSLVAWQHGSALDWQSHKFAALNIAFRYGGAFVLVPKDLAIVEPIVIRYRARETAIFPYTMVVACENSKVTIVSRLEGGAFEGALASEIVEVMAGSGSEVHFASVQNLAPESRVFSNKRAKIGHNAQVHWTVAELGAALSIGDVRSVLEQHGVRTSIGGVFFANEDQHIDIESEVDHEVGQTHSETLFKGAAGGRGQARYFGNIRIQHHAHGSDATLRDDALILSKEAHIDSVPALEIAANDVKAYHGATVGALDQDEVFYAMTRGIAREEAERMIALGFFEPAVARFPGIGLQAELREHLAAKLR